MSDEEKGLIGTIADLFDECAEAVEEATGRPAARLRKGARVCRKAKKAANSAVVAAVKVKRAAEKSVRNPAIEKLTAKIAQSKIVTIKPYET